MFTHPSSLQLIMVAATKCTKGFFSFKAPPPPQHFYLAVQLYWVAGNCPLLFALCSTFCTFWYFLHFVVLFALCGACALCGIWYIIVSPKKCLIAVVWCSSEIAQCTALSAALELHQRYINILIVFGIELKVHYILIIFEVAPKVHSFFNYISIIFWLYIWSCTKIAFYFRLYFDYILIMHQKRILFKVAPKVHKLHSHCTSFRQKNTALYL